MDKINRFETLRRRVKTEFGHVVGFEVECEGVVFIEPHTGKSVWIESLDEAETVFEAKSVEHKGKTMNLPRHPEVVYLKDWQGWDAFLATQH